MCTAISFATKDHYFGRNLDLEYSYRESVTITPRNYPFVFRKVENRNTHYAMIGMAYVVADYPLYYDAINEKGLGMAGLSFEGNACYYEALEGKENVSPFELIPYILGQCGTVEDAENVLSRIQIIAEDFSPDLPLSPLHWMISDKDRSIVVETLAGGMRVYPNPTGVLTNNPPFLQQLFGLNNYMSLSNKMPVNSFSEDIPLKVYSKGMGAIGLPGDLSSMSRFVRAVFVKENSVCGKGELESVGQFFHILGSVEQQKGLVYVAMENASGGNHEASVVDNGSYEITIYSSCCNSDKGIYYYKTYDNSQITAVDMHKEDLDGQRLVSYPLLTGQQIRWQNP